MEVIIVLKLHPNFAIKSRYELLIGSISFCFYLIIIGNL